MSRDSNGNYTLPVGNPVVSGTTISATTHNETMADISSELTDSLSRSGKGGLLAALRFFAGTVGAPGISWVDETASGLRRAGAGDQRYVVGGADVTKWTAGGFFVDVITALTATSATIKGAVADGAAAVGVILDTTVDFANAGAKILSVRRAGSEVAYINRAGALSAADGAFSGVVSATEFTPATTTGAVIRGDEADDASAVAVVVDNTNTLNFSVAKLLSVQNGGVQKASFDIDGSLNAHKLEARSTIEAAATLNVSPSAGANWTLTAALSRKSAGFVYLTVEATAAAGASFTSILTMPAGSRPLTLAPKGTLGVLTDASAGPLSYASWFDLSTAGVLSTGFYDNGTSLVAVPAAAAGDVVYVTIVYPVV